MASILEDGADATARRLEAVPRACGLVEIRADRLGADDVRGLVGRSPARTIVTARLRRDGGRFDGSEEDRSRILHAALDAGAAFVDVEWDGALAGLARGPHAARVILSHHGAPCRRSAVEAVYDAMAGTSAARLKIVPRAERPAEVGVVRDLLHRAGREGRALASFALGRAGTASRILAVAWGSWGTYGAIEPGAETGEGQVPVRDLLETYDVLGIGPHTRRFALVGQPLGASPSPAMHAAGYREAGIDARYLAVETDDFEDVLALTGPSGVLGLEGLGVTVPLKLAAAQRSEPADGIVIRSGAANTVLIRHGGWMAFNTDGPAAVACLRRHVDPAGARVAIVGAGGTARAVAAALAEAGAAVTLYNRDRARAERAAASVGVAAAPLEGLPIASWDILVQATPLGRHGEEVLPERHLSGRALLDVVYGPQPTPLVRAARGRGMVVIDGFELLVGQAVLQFEHLTGTRPREATLAAAGRAWLDSRRRHSTEAGGET